MSVTGSVHQRGGTKEEEEGAVSTDNGLSHFVVCEICGAFIIRAFLAILRGVVFLRLPLPSALVCLLEKEELEEILYFGWYAR